MNVYFRLIKIKREAFHHENNKLLNREIFEYIFRYFINKITKI